MNEFERRLEMMCSTCGDPLALSTSVIEKDGEKFCGPGCANDTLVEAEALGIVHETEEQAKARRARMVVCNIADFRKKWGAEGKTFRTLVEEYLRRSPNFPGDMQLCRDIGVAFADLESALKGKGR